MVGPAVGIGARLLGMLRGVGSGVKKAGSAVGSGVGPAARASGEYAKKVGRGAKWVGKKSYGPLGWAGAGATAWDLLDDEGLEGVNDMAYRQYELLKQRGINLTFEEFLRLKSLSRQS